METLTRPQPEQIAPPSRSTQLRCVTCRGEFDLDAGDSAVILRHIAYGFDLAHTGACLTAALDEIFVEPGYDAAAFSLDAERRRILKITAADGWFAVRPQTPQRILAGSLVRFEQLRWWALVEYADGSQRFEGVARDAEWDDAAGGLDFPEARRGSAACIGYTRQSNQPSSATRGRWASLVAAAYRGKSIRLNPPTSTLTRFAKRAA
jgi:hypothetical protein